MKKTTCIFLVLIIGLTTSLCACKKSDYKSSSNLTESEIEDCLQFAQNSAVSYYELLMSDNRNLAEIINKIEKQTDNKALLNNEISLAIGKIKEIIPDVFSSNLREYMAAKLFWESCSLVFSDEYEEIIKYDCNVVDWKIIDEHIICKVDFTINYKSVKRGTKTSPVTSVINERVQLVIKNANNPVIIDWYCSDPSSFDSKIRTYELDLFNTDNWLSKMDKEKLIKKLKGECVETFICYVTNAS